MKDAEVVSGYHQRSTDPTHEVKVRAVAENDP